MSVQVSSSNKVVQTESPIGPGYYVNLPTAFDNVLKKPASRVFGRSPHLSQLIIGNSRVQIAGSGLLGVRFWTAV